MTFGNQLQHFRKLAGFTQIELCEKLGIKQYNLTKYENDLVAPPNELLPKIAEVLGVSIDALFGRESPETLTVKPKRSKREGMMEEIFNELSPAAQRSVIQHAEGLKLRKKRN